MAKDAKSFVTASTQETSHGTPSLTPAFTAGHDKGKGKATFDDGPCSVQNLPVPGLPTGLEIRQSAESGRGIYSKENINIGK